MDFFLATIVHCLSSIVHGQLYPHLTFRIFLPPLFLDPSHSLCKPMRPWTLLFSTLLLLPTIIHADPPAGNPDAVARQMKAETIRAWHAYTRYAWGHDGFQPLTRSGSDWYEEPLGITLVDAYSTLSLMGFKEETKKIERYVVDSIRFDRDIYVKTFEVDIRILGGLLCMYHLSRDSAVLRKAEDFGQRLLPAFATKTGIPRYWVNLKTGQTRGDSVNVAEGGSSLLEMGILSYFTGKPVYYQAAKRAVQAIYQRRSALGLVAQDIDVETGLWLDEQSHVGACIDSYYEYLLKGWLLFHDPDLKTMWDASITAINRYLADEVRGELWYGRASMKTGKKISSVVTLYDAFFPGLLTLSGDTVRAAKLQTSWDHVWDENGLEPMVYDYRTDSILNVSYDLNPEILESAYYLYHWTGEKIYRQRAQKYFDDLVKF
ncbi:MAG: glycoside hydrolase family 47 protein, partial [Bacteroidota bacterium]